MRQENSGDVCRPNFAAPSMKKAARFAPGGFSFFTRCSGFQYRDQLAST
jgi:hypothetical protein